MHSNELAELAGVTVRTLRHYHQIGLLPEPDRSANGYRRYTARHLATVLRIVSFTDLGIPLSEVREVIDDPVAAMEVLERIDAHAAEEIERLAARRQRIDRMRANGALPDLPTALVPYARLLRPPSGRPHVDDVHEREQLALIAHFTRRTGMAWLVASLEKLSRSAARHTAVMDRFSALPDDATDEQIQAVVDALVELIAAAAPAAIPTLDSDTADLLLAHQEAYLTNTQRVVWKRVAAAIDGGAARPDRSRR